MGCAYSASRSCLRDGIVHETNSYSSAVVRPINSADQSSISLEDKGGSSGDDTAISTIAEAEYPVNWDLRFSDLKVEGHIASGAYCTVLACIVDGECRAVKVPLASSADPEGAVLDLENEIRILKRLRHPHLCSVYGGGGWQGGNEMPFLVLERLQYRNLSQQLGTDVDDASIRSRLRQRKVRALFPFRRRLQLGLQLAQLLRYLHSESIPAGFVIHRDLKPSNLGLSDGGVLKVFDFGLARVWDSRDHLTDRYVMTGQTGSQRFMAPEVFAGLPYNEKADIFSYAVVLWELCSLQKPFAGMTAHQHARKVFRQGFRPPLDRRWPQGLGDLLEECWNANPDRRPAASRAVSLLSAIVSRVNSGERSRYDRL